MHARFQLLIYFTPVDSTQLSLRKLVTFASVNQATRCPSKRRAEKNPKKLLFPEMGVTRKVFIRAPASLFF